MVLVILGNAKRTMSYEQCFAPGFSGRLDRIIVGADRMGAQAC